jgi:hypothetical protein
MKSICERCGAELPQIRLFRVACANCGAVHAATRNKKRAWIFSIYGASAFIVIPLALLLPGALWFKVLVVPLLYIFGGIVLALATQNWHIPSSK